ncbi:peptidase M50 [Mycobacterium gordonae]|uniref:Peptidase M50 n=1 Tax=Mycobacterium gordonae TaxID=1778 RepID=A0A0Q2MA02_MYCGO|nr:MULTISPECIES: hypothetical protein [Mycobacterium]KQH76679.1 peptidase M50 [Mycobacterium gordonae]MDP7730550.1 peptidase M50 [Mycobacterium sp. TY813]
MNTAENAPGVVVWVSDDARLPPALRGLPTLGNDEIGACRRLVVVGSDADLATVLTRLLRADRLDVEVAYAPRRRTRATRIYRLPTGRRAVRRALRGIAGRVPLIRDETGTALVGRARWLPAEGAVAIRGEAVVDDTVLFDGEVAEVWVEPTPALPGLRAAVRGRLPRWVSGRAAQLGTTGAAVQRDGVPAPRPVRRSAFYRHVEGWLLVR